MIEDINKNKFDSIEEMIEYHNRNKPLYRKLLDPIYYPILRTYNKIIMFPKKVKWFIQRGTRGWADCDVWSIDWFLTDIIPEMIDQLKETTQGPPISCYNKNDFDDIGNPIKGSDKKAQKKWFKILDEISEGFRLTRKSQNYEKLTKKEEQKINRAFKLFKDYYYSFWD